MQLKMQLTKQGIKNEESNTLSAQTRSHIWNCVFFALGLILRFSITYLHTKGFDVSHNDIVKTFVMSCIAGVGASIRPMCLQK
ncbi:hypothetical protein KLAE6086_18750 [Klebsiella aerogenes]|nr:Uncharacterised protein [Klebsiella aerogenes]